MNRLVIRQSEIAADGSVTLTDRRAGHLRSILRVAPGRRVLSGTLDGLIGSSTVLEVTPQLVRLLPQHDRPAAEPWFDLLLAMPRPKVFKRLLPQLAAMGLRQLVLLNACKVERCYFSTHWLEPQHYEPLLLEGLMQAGTTHLPQVTLALAFKELLEVDLEKRFPASWRLLAEPGRRTPLKPRAAPALPLLAIGPEGGWSGYELEALEGCGFERFALGGRTLRSDTACIALIAALGGALPSSG